MEERPMTKMFKRFAAALTAAILVAGLADAPARAHHDDLLVVIPHVGIIGIGRTYSNDGGSTWTATWQQYVTGDGDAAGDNNDGPLAGTFRFGYDGRYSNDGGSTWGARH